MFIVKDKNGRESARLSRYEQGQLAAINILSIKIQKMQEAGFDERETMVAALELADLQQSLSIVRK